MELGVFGTGSAGNPQHLLYRSLCKGEGADIRTSQKPLTWTPTWFAQTLKPQWKAKATNPPPREIGRMASTKMCKWVPPAPRHQPRHQPRRRYMKTRSHLIPRSMSMGIKQTPSIVISRSLALFLLPKMTTHTSFRIPTSFSKNWDSLLQGGGGDNHQASGWTDVIMIELFWWNQCSLFCPCPHKSSLREPLLTNSRNHVCLGLNLCYIILILLFKHLLVQLSFTPLPTLGLSIIAVVS